MLLALVQCVGKISKQGVIEARLPSHPQLPKVRVGPGDTLSVVQPIVGVSSEIRFEQTSTEDGYNQEFTDYAFHPQSRVVDEDGLRAQGNDDPLATFSNHAFVSIMWEGKERWLDPSYGVEYGDETNTSLEQKRVSFEAKALYGVGWHYLYLENGVVLENGYLIRDKKTGVQEVLWDRF